MTTAQPMGFLKPGGSIDSFRIIKALGQGANGLVLLVKRRGRQFALKLAQHREVSDHAGKTSARMSKELGCLLLLEHPNIIRARAWGRFPDLVGDYSYLVLDYVDGWTLAQWLEKTRPTLAQVARVFVKLADALDYMHRRGVFHRDISLSNILIRKEDGEPFVVDFGAGDFANAQELTEEALPPGTNRFRAPEAVRFYSEHKLDMSARYDFRAADDQYALAVCLYDALTDAQPATDAERRAVPRIPVNSPRMGPPPAPGVVNPRVPQALSALVAQAVEHDIAKRLPTLPALRSALEALASTGGAAWEAPVFAPTPPAVSTGPASAATRGQGRRRKVAAAGAVAVVAAAAAFALLRHEKPPQPDAPRPAPMGGPHARAPDAPAPSPAAPPVAEVPPPAPVAPAQKEAPTVSAPTPPASRQPPTSKRPRPTGGPAFTPEFLAKCAGLSLVAASQLGCPASQVRPTREECPAEAVRYMEKLGLDDRIGLELDENRKELGIAVYRTGPYTAILVEDAGDLKAGWRVEGQLWTEGTRLLGRFTKVLVPPGAKDYDGNPLPREVPVCIQLGGPGKRGIEGVEGSKPGAVRADSITDGHFTVEWNQP